MIHNIKSIVIKRELDNTTYISKEMIRAEAINHAKRYGCENDINKFINNQTTLSNFITTFLYLKFKEDILLDLDKNEF